MKTIANRRDYLDAVTDYAREWSNEVVITDGVHTETYTSCEIKITTPFSQDALSMGQSFTKELDLTIKQPERTLIYNLATIKVYSKLKVGESFVTVQMGEYFPSEVTTNDDYFSLNIKAYDFMGKLDVPYEPNTATIYRWSCDRKFYYVENGVLESIYRFYSLPSIRTGGELTFVNNTEDLTAWVYAKSNGVWVGRGLYDDTVNKLEPNGTLTVSCDEYIVSFDDYYVGGITVNGQDLAPMLTYGVVRDISAQYGFSTAGMTIGTEIDTVYEGTCAETLGWLAGLEGKNAIFNDDGNLVFRWYTIATREGGRWLDYPVTWATVENKSWADTTSQIVGMNITRTEQKERGANLNEGEFTIASITSGTEENPLTVGEGKGISFENPYMTAELLETIGNRELGKKTAVGTVQTFGNPLLEVGDIVGVIDKEGLAHTFFISNMEWNLTGGCSCVLTAIGNADADIEFSNVSPMEKKIKKVKSVLQGVVERFSNLINSLVGYYTITEENGVPTGWTIKDDLNNPVNMIKCSLGGIGISSNGGETYKTAITGEGIVADTITAGTINGIEYISKFSRTWDGTQYTSADVTRMEQLSEGSMDWTQEELEKYDFFFEGGFEDLKYAYVCYQIVRSFVQGSPRILNHTTEITYNVSPADAKILQVTIDMFEEDANHVTNHVYGFPKSTVDISCYSTSMGNGIFKVANLYDMGAGNKAYLEGTLAMRTLNSRTGWYQENGFIRDDGVAHFINGEFQSAQQVEATLNVRDANSTIQVAATTYNSSGLGNAMFYVRGNTYIGANCSVGSLTNRSKEELKKNIKPLGETLEKVKNADICTYKLKEDNSSHIGMVLGDKYNVPEEIIGYDKDGQPEGIDLYSMCSMLWKAVQELSAEVEELRGGNNVPD